MARSPWVVDITPLKRQPGVQHPFAGEFPAPDGSILATAEISAASLQPALQLEVAGEELIAQGTLTVTWQGPCRRCLEPQRGEVDVQVREIFQKVPVEGETWALDEDQVDLEPMIRETVLLHLPVAPLCRDDCQGPDPDDFPVTAAPEVDPTAEPPRDPRWAALDELLVDDDVATE